MCGEECENYMQWVTIVEIKSKRAASNHVDNISISVSETQLYNCHKMMDAIIKDLWNRIFVYVYSWSKEAFIDGYLYNLKKNTLASSYAMRWR